MENLRLEQTTLSMINDMLKQIDTNYILMKIYLDLLKGLDILDNNILIKELNYYGIMRTALSLFLL